MQTKYPTQQDRLKWCLFFPHKKLNSPLNFKFRVSGDFPFDDAKSILGPTAEKSLDNLKAPLLKCEGSGAVYKTSPEPLSDVNLTSFTLGINSSIPTTYSGDTNSIAERELLNDKRVYLKASSPGLKWLKEKVPFLSRRFPESQTW